MRCCLMSEPCPLPSCPAVPAKPWAATVSDGCPCTEEFSSNVDYDEDCTEQWRRLHRTMKKSFMYYPPQQTTYSLSPAPFSANLPPEELGEGRVVIGASLSISLYLSFSLFLILFFSSLFFAPTPSASRIPHPKQFHRTFITIWLWLQASSEVSTHTWKPDTLLSKQRVHQSFYQDSPFWLPIAAKTTPKTHRLNVAARIYYLCHSSLGWLGSASWFLFSTWHQLALPSSGGWHFQDHLLSWMAVGAASLLGAELEWPSSPLCGLSTCLVFL